MGVLLYFFKKFRKFSYIFLICFLSISILPIGKILEFNFLSKNFYGNNNITNFDSILILGGDAKRILHGISLWSKNKNSKIIFTGGTHFIAPTQSQKKKSETIRFDNLIKDLIDKKNYISIDNTRNTIENLREFKKIKKDQKFDSTIIVTSPWHYKRTMKIADKLNISLIPYKWTGNSKKNIIHSYQSINFANNLSQFDRFFRELIGIFALYIF